MSKYSHASQGDLELEKALLGLDGQGGVPATTGNIYYVIPATDSNYLEFYAKYFKQYKDGTVSIYNTVAAAYAATTSNRHDVIVLSANAAHAVTAMLDVSKNRVHFVGLGLRAGAFGMGARARITMGVTTAATDIAVMKNTGVGNTFRNIKFDSSNTKDESLYAVAEGGEYAIYENCEFYKSTDLDETGASELLMNGDSAQFIRCTIGSSANEIVGAILRPCVLLTATLSGKKCRDSIFSECIFLRKCGNTANRLVYGANATDVERMLYFKDCLFFSNPLGSATPAVGVDFGAGQTEGAVILNQGCASVDVTALGATGEGVYTLAPSSPTYATSGKAVNS